MPQVQSSLTIGPDVTVQTDAGSGYIGGQTIISGITQPITNQGTISAQTSGKTITMNGAPFTNQGLISATNGGLLSIGNLVNTGQINDSGTQLNLRNNVLNEGTISLDDGATISTTGNYTQNSAGVLDFILLAPPSGNNALFSIPYGTAELDGQLAITLGDGFNPAVGTSWTLISADSINGTFTLENFPAGESFQIQYQSNSVTLTVLPEPCSVGLGVVSAFGLLLRRRRR